MVCLQKFIVRINFLHIFAILLLSRHEKCLKELLWYCTTNLETYGDNAKENFHISKSIKLNQFLHKILKQILGKIRYKKVSYSTKNWGNPTVQCLFAYLAKNRNRSFWIPVTLSSLSAKYTESQKQCQKFHSIHFYFYYNSAF